MSKDLKNALRSARDMEEYLEFRSSQEIIDDIKESAGQEILRGNRTYFQSHTCEGFSARVTIEWSVPPTAEETIIVDRIAAAGDIAESILSFAGPQVRDMVQVMRGYSPAERGGGKS